METVPLSDDALRPFLLALQERAEAMGASVYVFYVDDDQRYHLGFLVPGAVAKLMAETIYYMDEAKPFRERGERIVIAPQGQHAAIYFDSLYIPAGALGKRRN